MPSNGLGANGLVNGVGGGTLGKRKRPAPTESNGDDNPAPEELDDEDEASRQVKRRGIVPEGGMNGDVSNEHMAVKTGDGTVEQMQESGNGADHVNGVEPDAVIVLDEDEDAAGAITIDDDD